MMSYFASHTNKKSRDKTNMPSAFIQFSNEKRAQVQAENPKAGFGEMGKLLGKMWKALSEEEKAKYVVSTGSSKKKKTVVKKSKDEEAEPKEDAEEAEPKEDAEEAEPKEDAEEAEPKKKSSKKVAASKKKRAPSAFIVFSNKMRDEIKQANPKASFSELGKLLGKKWQALSDEEKAAYKSGGSGTRRRIKNKK